MTIKLVKGELTLIDPDEERRKKTRFFLAGMAIGAICATIGLFLGVGKANATVDTDAVAICQAITGSPTMRTMDNISMNLLLGGYGTKGAAAEIEYAVINFCPQNAATVERWRTTPTGPNGVTPETIQVPVQDETGVIA